MCAAPASCSGTWGGIAAALALWWPAVWIMRIVPLMDTAGLGPAAKLVGVAACGVPLPNSRSHRPDGDRGMIRLVQRSSRRPWTGHKP